jgi:hypothetical protein
MFADDGRLHCQLLRMIDADMTVARCEAMREQDFVASEGRAADSCHQRPGAQTRASRWPSTIWLGVIFEATALRSLK